MDQSTPSKTSPKKALAGDYLVGRRIKALRQTKGLTKVALAATLGLNVQQINKYESGANRVSAGRLQGIARVLGVPVASLIDAHDDGRDDQELRELLRRHGAADLMAAYAAIEDVDLRRAVLAVVRTAARMNWPTVSDVP